MNQAKTSDFLTKKVFNCLAGTTRGKRKKPTSKFAQGCYASNHFQTFPQLPTGPASQHHLCCNAKTSICPSSLWFGHRVMTQNLVIVVLFGSISLTLHCAGEENGRFPPHYLLFLSQPHKPQAEQKQQALTHRKNPKHFSLMKMFSNALPSPWRCQGCHSMPLTIPAQNCAATSKTQLIYPRFVLNHPQRFIFRKKSIGGADQQV